jgi:hypothetical protein
MTSRSAEPEEIVDHTDWRFTGWRYCGVCGAPVGVVCFGWKPLRRAFGGWVRGDYRCKKHTEDESMRGES